VNARIADALVLAFSDGVSLRVWADTGLIDREWELYRRLAPLVGRIILATYGKADDAEFLARLAPGVGLVCNATGLKPEEYVRILPRLIADQLGPDCRSVIVKTNQMSGGDAATAIAGALRAPGRTVALIARGGYLWSQFAAWEGGAASPNALAAGEREGRLCRAADLVVGTTRQMVDDLAWRHAVPESRLAVIPNYVLPGDTRREVERAPNVILFAGRLVPQKRIDRLIEAVSCLRPALRETVTLSIVGDGPLQAQLAKQAQDSGVRVSFEGRMPHEQLLERMRRCTLYAQTSSYEGHPKTVIEAMSVGTPVLLCDTPGLRGLVRHGANGLCVAPDIDAVAFALEGLLDDADWRRSLGEAAAAHAAASFGLDHIVDLEAGAYRRALAQAAAHGRPEVDITRAVRWSPELLTTRVPKMVEGWERSLAAFTQRLEPRPRAEFLAALDGPIYNMQGFAACAAEGGLHPKHRLMRYHDFFTERITPGQRVIDLGCGVGALAASIAEFSRARVTGMDWTGANLEKARKIAAERGLSGSLDYVQGDITRDRAPGRFDAVVLSNVLEHITDRVQRLRQWLEWYSTRFLIRVPAFDREWRVPWKKELGAEWRLDLTHETEYTRSQLDEEIARAGLRIVECTARWGEYWLVAEAA
jgi:glycosyltransferase involved in cell wall biosynthesis/SAM-dependent methyltransferase